MRREGLAPLDVAYRKEKTSQPVESLGPEHEGATVSVFETAEAEWWRVVSSAAVALPRTFPRRWFLGEWSSSGNLEAAARAAGIGRKEGRLVVRRFLLRLWATGQIAKPRRTWT